MVSVTNSFSLSMAFDALSKSSNIGSNATITSSLAVENNSNLSLAVLLLKFSNSAKSLKNFSFSSNETFLNLSSYFTQGQPLYMLLYASGIIFFTFFYTSITFNPTETAENLRKYGGFVPGIRPGESTALYIENILTKLTTMGALYLTLVCLMPEFLIANYPIPFYLGGTSILIVVVVAIDTVTQIQTRLMSSQYEQLIKKTKFGK